jgi:hypothetical protein
LLRHSLAVATDERQLAIDAHTQCAEHIQSLNDRIERLTHELHEREQEWTSATAALHERERPELTELQAHLSSGAIDLCKAIRTLMERQDELLADVHDKEQVGDSQRNVKQKLYRNCP